MQLQWPEPSDDARVASEALRRHIVDQIHQQGGWISFARYMELVLYTPGLGYYSGGAAKIGQDGDFTTAPEISPLFGATLAQVAIEIMRQSSPAILEFGAGTGSLAFSLLEECEAQGRLPETYSIVDLSGELRERQQQRLSRFSCVRWLDQMPTAFSGLVLGNELLDAMPVHLVCRGPQSWLERGVALNERGFVFADRAQADISQSCEQQIPDAGTFETGYVTEIHPQAIAFIRTLADMLHAGRAQTGRGGAALLIDYGFPQREYYLPERNEGTVMCHYRHHSHPDPFYLPGLQDVTAHVDFSAMARAAVEGGLDLLSYTSQAAFLTHSGLGELVLRTSPEDSARYLRQTNAVQKLISPAETGELFKVLMVGTGVELPDRYLEHDRCHRL